MLVEGNSIHATARMAGVSVNAVLRLFAAAARFSSEYQDRMLNNLDCRRIQLDEIWGFVYAKQKNVPTAKSAPPQAGDVWTWVAIDPDSKLVASWRVGDRTQETATEFVQDLEGRLAGRIQLTSDGYHAYINAVGSAFGEHVDYAMLAKIYSPAEVDQRKVVLSGDPDPDHISTSLVERQNLTMRMSIRRFTRKTNGFSKKLLNHAYSVALHFMYYNFIRAHASLDGLTPAQAAGVADRPYTMGWLVEKVERAQPKPNRPSFYKPRQRQVA
ncbi:MAG: IS1 family transposase [Gemmatimonadota bacterium]|nr:IS1 family transposase [Gemmatimonadota bacterium]